MGVATLTGAERQRKIEDAVGLRYEQGLRWREVLDRVGVTHGEQRFKQDVREHKRTVAKRSKTRELLEAVDADGRREHKLRDNEGNGAGESANGFAAETETAPLTWENMQGTAGDDDVPIERILRIAELFKGLTNAADPVYTGGELRITANSPIAVMFLSCAHLGGRYTDHMAFWTLIQRALAIPNVYFAMLGDDIDGFLPGHIDRESELKQPLNIDIQVILIKKITALLADAKRLLFGMSGQHSGDWMNKRYGHNPVKDAYTSQGVPYFDGQAYFPLLVGSQRYMIAVSHQFPGYSMHNPLHAHGRALRWNFPMADVIAQGDKHTFAMSEQMAYEWEHKVGNRPSPYVWFVQTGTAKTGPDKYTIKRFSEGTFMWPVLFFGSEKHQVEGIKHLSMAQARLAAPRVARGG